MYNKKMQYVIKTCPIDDVQELQNLLNEMSMNGWELYNIVETDDGVKCNCIFMNEIDEDDINTNADIINISTFKSQMEKMLSLTHDPYENCLEIQAKIRTQKEKISKIKTELEGEPPASPLRKKLNDKISAGLKELDELKIKLSKTTSPDEMYSKLKEEKLSIHLSEEILGYVDPEQDLQEEELVAETVKTRVKLTEELGYVIPKIVFQDDENLNPFEFSIKIRGLEVFKAFAYPKYLMYFADEIHLDKKIKSSITDIDKITEKKIIWIEKDKTKDFWQKGLSGSEFIARALESTTIKYVNDLLDYEELDKYLDIVSDKNEFLVENIVPNFTSLANLKFILTSLIREKISIKDIIFIFEKINDFVEDNAKADFLLKKIRLSLSRQICHNNSNEDGAIQAIELSEKTLSEIGPVFDKSDDAVVIINRHFAEKFAIKFTKKIKQLEINKPILIAPLEFRELMFSLLSHYINDVTVLARAEIGCNCQLEILGEI